MMGPLLEENGFELKKIEISESEELVERYGIRIPVIRLRENLRGENSESVELGWPFDLDQLRQFLSVAK